MLQGKVALVTGATRGIGAAAAALLAEQGASVVLTGRDGEAGEALARKLTEAGRPAAFKAAHITAPGTADELVSFTLCTFGRLDILINNAGILRHGSALECSDEDWDDTFAVNVTAAFRASRAALRVMVPQRSGAIVNVASDWALVGGTRAVAYAASKGALAQLTRSMALDHAKDGIRVNAVCPGDTDTQMLGQGIAAPARAAHLDSLARAIPLGRVAEPIEVARVIAFLASDAASFMTGALVPVDGGNTAQ